LGYCVLRLRQIRDLLVVLDCGSIRAAATKLVRAFVPRQDAVVEILADDRVLEGLPFPSRYVHCESFALTLGLLRSSDALALLVPQVLQDANGALLQEIPLKRPPPEISVGMYRRADTPTSAALNDFWGHLVRGVRELARQS